jgi:hypothetical protein
MRSPGWARTTPRPRHRPHRGYNESCEVAGHTRNNYNVLNEETKDHRDILVCRNLRYPWPEFWKQFRYYG